MSHSKKKQGPQPGGGGKPAGGPPTVFSMPMFHDWVPKRIRPWIYLLGACCFQLSNGVYLGALNQMVGENAVMREDVRMCLYASLAGMAIYFPILFRMKFRFTNRFLLICAALTVIACNLLVLLPLPSPVLWMICFVAGMAKIQGTFEHMSNIQLWITPKRNFGVFFPVLHLVLLTAMDVSAYLAAIFAYEMHWTLMHWFVTGLMFYVLFVQVLLTRPFHAMPQIVPLKGFDFFGISLWAVLFLQIAWLLNYGDWLDYWDAPAFRLVTGTALITAAVCIQRMLYHPRPYYEPAMWKYPHVVPILLLIAFVDLLFSCENVLEAAYFGGTMRWETHTTELFQLFWATPGSWLGCIFSLVWLKLLQWNPYKLIATGLCVFSVYAAQFYFLLDFTTALEMFRLALFCRGFAYAVLSIALMWSLNECMSFQHFFQILSIFNMLHMYVGGLVGTALHNFAMRYYMYDGIERYSGYVTPSSLSGSIIGSGFSLDALNSGLQAQSMKILFGWTLYASLFFAAAMLLWDIPAIRQRIRLMQSWPHVGVLVYRGFRRQQKLKRLRHLRAEQG